MPVTPVDPKNCVWRFEKKHGLSDPDTQTARLNKVRVAFDEKEMKFLDALPALNFFYQEKEISILIFWQTLHQDLKASK